MICPKCGWTEANHIEAKKSDKEHYLEFWGYTLGTPEAEQAWKEKQEMTFRAAPAVLSDISGYVSQVDGSWIDSRSKHRNHLKQHRMIELGNDVLTQHKPIEISRQSNEARKRQIAEMAYSKLNYR
jgi:peroxiredoxin